MKTQMIRVFYPVNDARILLRTEEDWDKNIAPSLVNEYVSEFAIATSRPFFYFKPVLETENGLLWYRGENYLATTTFD